MCRGFVGKQHCIVGVRPLLVLKDPTTLQRTSSLSRAVTGTTGDDPGGAGAIEALAARFRKRVGIGDADHPHTQWLWPLSPQVRPTWSRRLRVIPVRRTENCQADARQLLEHCTHKRQL